MVAPQLLLRKYLTQFLDATTSVQLSHVGILTAHEENKTMKYSSSSYAKMKTINLNLREK